MTIDDYCINICPIIKIRLTIRGDKVNRGEEDYIKVLYELQADHNTGLMITNAELVDHFKHTPQTVNEMIRKLVDKGLVEYVPYKGSTLTEMGKEIAIHILRIHRIWETFLQEKLGYSWEEVHEDAELLEHVTSKKLEERMYKYLGEPLTCPHGNQIVDLHDQSSDMTINLLKAEIGIRYHLVRVMDNKELLNYLNELQISIGQNLILKKIDKFSEFIIVDVDSRSVNIGFKVARQLFVTKC